MSKKKKKPSKKQQQTLFAFIASFFTIIGFIIALIAKRDDEYVMFYAVQGLVLFIYSAIISLIDLFLLDFLTAILWILWIVLWVITWINALSGKMKYTFLVKDLAKKIKF